MLLVAKLSSPLGEMRLVADREGFLRGLEWGDSAARLEHLLALRWGALELRQARDPHGFCSALSAYFTGTPSAIDDLPVKTGGTPFQQTVWQALRKIPHGTTVTYRELAAAAGRPHAIRAAGAANGANAISLVIPCHRVIGSDGSLTGYAGGLKRKQWLLAHERAAGT